jgi:uncharacterized membrane protein
MNDAHLHMLVNHFPIIGPILGLGILIVGMILKNKSVTNIAYGLFIISAIFAAFSMATGEGAEEITEKLPEVTKHIIHEHEEMAEKLALVLYLLGVISIIGMYTNLKNNAKAKLVSYIVLTVAAVVLLLAQQTGTTGGEVRHTEIRSETSPTIEVGQNSTDEKEDKQ